MKIKTTKKAIQAGYNTVLSIGYCDIQYLLYFRSPFAYSAGVYGWYCDYYAIDDICISTGYDPTGAHVPYRLTKKYEDKARAVVLDYSVDYDKRKKKTEKLLNKLRLSARGF